MWNEEGKLNRKEIEGRPIEGCHVKKKTVEGDAADAILFLTPREDEFKHLASG